MIDLSNKGWVIFGMRGGGKSWLTEHILDSTPSHLIYDPLNEHKGYNQYIPTDRESVEELDIFVRHMAIKWKPRLLAIDEANKYIQPKPNRLPTGIADLVDFARHWKMSFGCIARRPVQFHTDIIELADVVFFFRLRGRNDYQYMNDLMPGLGDKVRGLEKHQFVMLNDGDMTVHAPIDEPIHAGHT